MVSREQWKEPDMILKSSFALTKLSHVFAGIVFWQFVSNLDFDYSMLTGKRRQRWTFWVYLSSRLACIGIVISSLIMINSRRPVNCQALIISLETLQAVAYALSLLLAMLRVVAIWDRLLPVIALCAIAWLTSVAFWIRIVAMVHLSPIPPFSSVAGASMCFITSSPPFLPLSIVTLFIYFVLLAGMIGGLARKPHLGSVGIWKLLYRQGLAWLALATIAELPTLVLLCINLNDVMNFILQVPRVLITSMAATMMYRALHNYAATSEYEAERRAQGERPPLVRVGKPDALRLEPLEVTVFTTFEQHHDMDSEGEMARSKSGLSIRSRAHEDGGTPTLII